MKEVEEKSERSSFKGNHGKKYSKKNNSKRRDYESKGSANRQSKYAKTEKPDDKAATYAERRGNDVNQYVGQGNNPEWYSKNGRLIMDASKIPFSNQLGTEIYTFKPQDGGADFGSQKSMVVPGVTGLYMVNTPGVAASSSDGANIAAAGLFQFIRKNLSTTATYAPADTMMYVLGLDELYSMYSNILRLFGIINAYSAVNLYLPDAIIRAGYGFSQSEIDAIKHDINDYRSRFNNLIYKASTLYLPTDFSITSRHAWLYSNYFSDSPTSKAQLYIHRMGLYHLLDEVSSTQGTCLKTHETSYTLTGLLNVFESMINAFRNSDSMLRIAADMRRAFEGRSQWKLAYCDEAYMVLPTYDALVLEQIHNMTIFPNQLILKDMSQMDIIQNVNKNTISFQPHYSVDPTSESATMIAAIPALSGKILNFHHDEVNPVDIMESTRNIVTMYANKDVVSNKYDLFLTSCSADICYTDLMVTINAAGTDYEYYYAHGNVMDLSVADSWSEKIAWVNAFNMMPQMWTTSSSTLPKTIYPMFDLDNYTSVANSVIERLNDNIICSMWSIPEFGGFDA